MTNSAAASADHQEEKMPDAVNGDLKGETKEKSSRKETDKKYNDKKKAKLQHYPEVCNDLENKSRECEYLKKLVELNDEAARKDAKRIEIRDSQVSLLLRQRLSENQHSQSLSRIIEVMQKEKDELKKERDELKKERDELKKENEQLKSLPPDLDFFDFPSPTTETNGGESEMNAMGITERKQKYVHPKVNKEY